MSKELAIQGAQRTMEILQSLTRLRFSVGQSDTVRGAAWMLTGTIVFAGVTAAVKEVGQDLPATVTTFFRAAFGLLALLPLLFVHGIKVFRTKRPELHTLRLFGSVGGVTLGYYALAHLPLATATALSFTQPLFMILIAGIFLREVVRWRRGLATVVGFVGVLAILGPTELAFNLAALVALGGAASQAVASAVIRNRAGDDGPLTILAWFSVGILVLSAPLAAWFWETPQGVQWLYLVFIGLAASLAQFCTIKALTFAEATVMNPIDYTRIIFAAILGYLMFSEIPTIWTAVGAATIIASTLYILFREARVSRRAVEPLPLKE